MHTLRLSYLEQDARDEIATGLTFSAALWIAADLAPSMSPPEGIDNTEPTEPLRIPQGPKDPGFPDATEATFARTKGNSSRTMMMSFSFFFN